VAKQFALQEPCWNCGTVEFYEWATIPVAQAVNRVSDQFLPRACVPEDQHRRLTASHGCHLFQHLLYSGTFSDDFGKLVLGPGFSLKIAAFLSQPSFELLDFFGGPMVFNGYRELRGDLVDQFQVARFKCVKPRAP
jgi:hypothetical protein